MDSDDTLSFSEEEHLHEQCEKFIARWKDFFKRQSPRAPDLGEYLGDTKGRLRTLLFEQLLDIDLYYRWTSGGSPRREEYKRRFPEFEETIRRLFQIHRYEIVGLLGRGAFGSVYRARDPKLDREVAIKVPHPDRITEPEDVEAFLREARNVAKLDHPNIVPVFDCGDTNDGRCFVVSKLIEGGSVKDHIAEKRPTFEESARLVGLVAGALHHAHQQEIVHRDVKPANILIDGETPYLADFGLAIHRKDSPFSQGGTPIYMSPEQAKRKGRSVTPQSDIFSLGIVLYELLTGKHPFPGTDAAEVMRKIADPEYDAWQPSNFDANIPPELERICRSCLVKTPNDRPTAADLVCRLNAYLGGLSQVAHSHVNNGKYPESCEQRIDPTANTLISIQSEGCCVVFRLDESYGQFDDSKKTSVLNAIAAFLNIDSPPAVEYRRGSVLVIVKHLTKDQAERLAAELILAGELGGFRVFDVRTRLASGLQEPYREAAEADVPNTDFSLRGDDVVSLPAATQVDQPDDTLTFAAALHDTVERFVAAWWRRLTDASAGRLTPRLEEFLGELSGAERNVLLRELLDVDVFYRQRIGENPTPDDYAHIPGAYDVLDTDSQNVEGRDGVIPPWEVSPPTAHEQMSVSFSADSFSSEPPPAVIGRYAVESFLGTGAFGRIYRARDPQRDRDVAVEVTAPGEVGRPEDVEIFFREARLVARLDHPNIVPVFGYGRTDDGRCYVVRELIDGQSLRERLATHRPPLDEAVRLVIRAAEALQHAHQNGIVHRDIKPANILIDADGAPYIVVFGLAPRYQTDYGQPAGLIGTPAYMSPEQASGDLVDGRSDIFSLGVVLYELLTGQRPFTGTTISELLEGIRQANVRSMRELDSSIDPELQRICDIALQKRREDRYQTAYDMAHDLRPFVQSHTDSSSSSPTDAKSSPTRSERLPLQVVIESIVTSGVSIETQQREILDRISRLSQISESIRVIRRAKAVPAKRSPKRRVTELPQHYYGFTRGIVSHAPTLRDVVSSGCNELTVQTNPQAAMELMRLIDTGKLKGVGVAGARLKVAAGLMEVLNNEKEDEALRATLSVIVSRHICGGSYSSTVWARLEQDERLRLRLAEALLEIVGDKGLLETISLMLQGMDDRQISIVLNLSKRSVQRRKYRLQKKMLRSIEDALWDV